MIVSLWGVEGCGKSSLALSFPRPLFHLDLDLGGFERAAWRLESEDIAIKRLQANESIERVVWTKVELASKPYVAPLQKEKLLGIQKNGVSVRFPRQVVNVKELWQEIVTDIVNICSIPLIKTIVVDSATQLWSICHQGLLQEKQEVQLSQGVKAESDKFREKLMPIEFPNSRMRDLIYTVRSFGKNLVMTHYPKDVYAEKLVGEKVESYKTGEVELDGFKHTVALDDLVLWCYTEVDRRKEVAKKPNPDYNKFVPRAKISLKCGLRGLGMKAVGVELPEPSYAGLMELQKMLTGEE